MCQMCEEYEAELRRLGIEMDEKVTVEFESETFEALSRQAEAHGHSVVDEVRQIVQRNVVSTRTDVPRKDGRIDFVEWARRIRDMTPPGVPQTDSVKLIREDRDHGHSIDRR